MRCFPTIGLLALAVLPGCTARWSHPQSDLADYQAMATQMEFAAPEACDSIPAWDETPPLTIHDYQQAQYWDLTLEEAIQRALGSSKVLRDLGGRVLTSPDNVESVYDPALAETDPRFGVEAALSAFDAVWDAGMYFENNDRALNNQFLGGGTRLLQQDLGNFETGLSKTTATGGEYRLRHTWDYDANNAPGNIFSSAWTAMVDAEVRHPLLKGSGREFNRVYGPNGTPGLPRGVLVARMNTDINLAEFHAAVRQLVSDVENTYWELQYAYRDLDAKLRARARAQKTWQVIADWKERGRVGGEADKEAAAREQFYRLHADVQLALTGRPMDDTRSTNFRGQGGVQAQERRLRLLIGAPINDGQLIRPVDQPSLVKIEFQWSEVLATAMDANPVLRRQQWKLRREETVLSATRNLLLPEVNLLGRYRWRGFGHDLLNSNPQLGQFDNAYQNLTSGDFQEWQLGMEMVLPVGQRQANVAHRNAILSVARERAVLEEQQRTVVHHLSASRAAMESAYEMARTQYSRVAAAHDQVKALETLAADPEPNQLARLIDQLLVAQRTLADAESQFFREAASYAVSVKNVHFYKGSLLAHNGVFLTEGGWPEKAYHDAAEKRSHSKATDFKGRPGPVVSAGPAYAGAESYEMTRDGSTMHSGEMQYAEPHAGEPQPAEPRLDTEETEEINGADATDGVDVSDEADGSNEADGNAEAGGNAGMSGPPRELKPRSLPPAPARGGDSQSYVPSDGAPPKRTDPAPPPSPEFNPFAATPMSQPNSPTGNASIPHALPTSPTQPVGFGEISG